MRNLQCLGFTPWHRFDTDYKLQSISCLPCLFNNSLVLEKCLLPKKAPPDRGEGWAASNTKCLEVSIKFFFAFAKLPQSRKIIPSFSSDIFLITASVKICQPHFACELGSPAFTVSDAFSRSTPCFAQCSKLPWVGGSIPKSVFIYLKILTRDGGGLMPCCTEKHKPCACPAPW